MVQFYDWVYVEDIQTYIPSSIYDSARVDDFNDHYMLEMYALLWFNDRLGALIDGNEELRISMEKMLENYYEVHQN